MQQGGERKAKKPLTERLKQRKRNEFSKRLIFWEGLLVCAISAGGLYIAYLAVIHAYLGSLPWVTAMVTGAWGAYGVSQAFYYSKAKAENILKISKSNGDSAGDMMNMIDLE